MTQFKCPNCENGLFVRRTYDTVTVKQEEDGLTDELNENISTIFTCAKCDKHIGILSD